MKKILLSLAVASMATAMNAQQIASAQAFEPNAPKKVEAKAINIPFDATAGAGLKDFTAVKAQNKGMMKAPALSDLYGNYVQDDVADIHECYAASIASYNYTSDGVTYNVNVKMMNGYIDVIGVYQGDSIVIPAQYCYEVAEGDDDYDSFGECQFALYNLNCDASGNPETYDANNIVFDVNDDGSLSLRTDGYYVTIEGGTYDGYYYNYGIGTSVFPANATQTITSSGTDYDYDGYVEDYETMIGVYNAFGFGGYFEMSVNDDLTVSVDPGQHMFAQSSSYVSQGYSEYYDLYLYFQKDGSWYFNMTNPLTGVLSGNTVTFDYGFSIISTVETEDGTSGRGWGFTGYTLTLNEGNFLADGIKEVNTNREDKIKNTKTYNLMGQQVNRDNAKGLLIYGGKKYIKK